MEDVEDRRSQDAVVGSEGVHQMRDEKLAHSEKVLLRKLWLLVAEEVQILQLRLLLWSAFDQV